MIRNILTLFFLCLPLMAISCSNNDNEETGKIKLPVTIDFQKKSLEVNDEDYYTPLEIDGFECWSVNNGDRSPGDFLVIPSPTEEDENILSVELIKYDASKPTATGVVDMIMSSLLVDLSPVKNISKITIVGFGNDSKMFAGVYNETTRVVNTTAGPGPAETEIRMVLNVEKNPVTQLYVTGEEAFVKRIIIE